MNLYNVYLLQVKITADYQFWNTNERMRFKTFVHLLRLQNSTFLLNVNKPILLMIKTNLNFKMLIQNGEKLIASKA